MEQYKLVIFDWDGTLIDSIARIVSSLQQAAIHCQFPVPCDISVKGIIGLSLSEAITQLFPVHTKAQEIKLIEQYKLQYRELDNTPSPLFPRSRELLLLLKTQKRKLAIATGKGRAGLQLVWEETDTGHLFDSSICADEAESKPHPQMLQALLKEFSLAPHQAIMIGDSRHDLKMAANANIDSIGVTLGVDNEQELMKYNPKAVVHSLFELENLFT